MKKSRFKSISVVMLWLRRFFDFFFRPNRFIEESTEEAIFQEFQENAQLREKYPAGDMPIEMRGHLHNLSAERTRKLRISILSSLVLVASIFIAAWLSTLILKSLFDSFPTKTMTIIRLFSAGLILWAVAGRLSWEIQSFKNRTLPERLNRYWFKMIYGIGIYLLTTSIFLSELE